MKPTCKRTYIILAFIMAILFAGGGVMFYIGTYKMDFDDGIIEASQGKNSTCDITDKTGGWNYYEVSYKHKNYNKEQSQKLSIDIDSLQFVINESHPCWSQDFRYGRIAIYQREAESPITLAMRYGGLMLLLLSGIYFILLGAVILFTCSQRDDPKIIYRAAPWSPEDDAPANEDIPTMDEYDDAVLYKNVGPPVIKTETESFL